MIDQALLRTALANQLGDIAALVSTIAWSEEADGEIEIRQADSSHKQSLYLQVGTDYVVLNRQLNSLDGDVSVIELDTFELTMNGLDQTAIVEAIRKAVTA